MTSVQSILDKYGPTGLFPLVVRKVCGKFYRPVSSSLDLEYGIETGQVVLLDQLHIDSKNARFGVQYEATGEGGFRRIVSELSVDVSAYTFLDYGCGKGRGLILAALCGFRRIIGKISRLSSAPPPSRTSQGSRALAATPRILTSSVLTPPTSYHLENHASCICSIRSADPFYSPYARALTSPCAHIRATCSWPITIRSGAVPHSTAAASSASMHPASGTLTGMWSIDPCRTGGAESLP